MGGRNSLKRFLGLAAATVLLVGSGIGVAIFLSATRSPFRSPAAPGVRSGDERAAGSMAVELATAIRGGDVRTVRRLLDDGADVNARDAAGNTPLILAAFYAGPECVELLLERGADVNAANKAGVTPLIRAATDPEKTRLLVDAGANVRVRLLLAHGADPNAAGGESVGAFGLVPQTPRRIAEKRGRTAVIDALEAAGADDPPRAVRGASPR